MKAKTIAARIKNIQNDDALATEVGTILVGVLGLPCEKVDSFGQNRYATSWGNKTACGLARTVARILAEGDGTKPANADDGPDA